MGLQPSPGQIQVRSIVFSETSRISAIVRIGTPPKYTSSTSSASGASNLASFSSPWWTKSTSSKRSGAGRSTSSSITRSCPDGRLAARWERIWSIMRLRKRREATRKKWARSAQSIVRTRTSSRRTVLTSEVAWTLTSAASPRTRRRAIRRISAYTSSARGSSAEESSLDKRRRYTVI